jgi:beta-galactosidase
VHGGGRVTYVGTLPDRALSVALARWLRAAPDAWADRPETVTVTSARNRAGETVRFVSNWSWVATSVALPVAAQDLLSGTELRRGAELDLGAWDVRVLVESPRDENNEEGSSP